MAVESGYKGKCTLGDDLIAELGTWGMTGQENEMLPSTSFGDDFLEVTPGRGDGGIATFAGNYDPTNAAGQTALLTAWNAKTPVNSIRLWFGDGTNDFFFCEGPNTTTYVASLDGPSTDQSGIGTIGFSLKVTHGYLKEAKAAFSGSLTFVTPGDTITKVGGTAFGALGFENGDKVTVRGSTLNNVDGSDHAASLTITNVADDVITVSDTLANEGPTANVRLIAV